MRIFVFIIAAASASTFSVDGNAAEILSNEVAIRSCPDLGDYYPQAALRQGIEGVGRYRISIDPAGSVADVKLEQSTGDNGLDTAGQRFLLRCRFVRSEGTGQRIITKSVTFKMPD